MEQTQMTTDEIETAAIEAAAKAAWDTHPHVFEEVRIQLTAPPYFKKELAPTPWESDDRLVERDHPIWRERITAAIRAYEREMWRPISELGNHRTGQVLIADLADPHSGTPQRPYHSLELINADSMFNQNSGNKVDARYLSHYQYFRPVPPLPRREGE